MTTYFRTATKQHYYLKTIRSILRYIPNQLSRKVTRYRKVGPLHIPNCNLSTLSNYNLTRGGDNPEKDIELVANF